MKRWDDYKFRCSSLGHIMTDGRGTQITELQLTELSALLEKIKITDKQAARRDELIGKRDAKPELSSGAKTYLRTIWKEETFQIRSEISSKYTEKGNLVEDESISFASQYFGWGLLEGFGAECKNRLTNDFITGEPDVNWDPTKVLADVKSSWDLLTFPMFEKDLPNPDYDWQGKGYLYLSGKSVFQLVYCLMDTPEHLINDAIRKEEYKQNVIELSAEDEKEIRWRMTFSHLEPAQRMRIWKIAALESDFRKIDERVLMARDYLNNLDGAYIKITEEVKSQFTNF